MNRCLPAGFLILALLALLCCAFAQFPKRRPNEIVPEVDQTCMNCICQASSNCDETIKCHGGGSSSYFCGAYVVSWAYWHDGGRPGDKGRAHDFETCLTNKTCAEEAVRGYMRKYGQDCDGSGDINCYDFVRIHKLGFSSCGGEAIYNTDYWEKFEICYAGYPPSENVEYNYDGGVDGGVDSGVGVIQARNNYNN